MNPEPTNDDAPRKKRRPAPAVVVDQRVRQIAEILLEGALVGIDVCETVHGWEQEEGSPWRLKEGEKPLSYSQIQRYVHKAEALIAADIRASRKRHMRRHHAQRRRLYAKAVSQGDVRAALSVLDSEARLLDLFPNRDSVPPDAAKVTVISGVDAEAALGRKKADADAHA